MIKETDGVGDFIGSNGKPSPMSPKDEAKMLEAAERKEETQSEATAFKKGEKVKVTNGAFMNFEGEVDEVIADKCVSVRIITTIFGRPTPLGIGILAGGEGVKSGTGILPVNSSGEERPYFFAGQAIRN